MPYSRVVGAWLVLAIAMSANGVFRELVLRRSIGPARADIVSALLGAAIILLVTARFFRPFARLPVGDIGRASGLLVALTVSFEFLFGHYVDRRSWSELIENYALWRGRLWPLLLVVIGITPFVWGRWARPRLVAVRQESAEAAAVKR
jgi:hypothetical protein